MNTFRAALVIAGASVAGILGFAAGASAETPSDLTMAEPFDPTNGSATTPPPVIGAQHLVTVDNGIKVTDGSQELAWLNALAAATGQAPINELPDVSAEPALITTGPTASPYVSGSINVDPAASTTRCTPVSTAAGSLQLQQWFVAPTTYWTTDPSISYQSIQSPDQLTLVCR